MEVLQNIKIVVKVSTNKAVYQQEFDVLEIDTMYNWMENITGVNFRTTQDAPDPETGAAKSNSESTPAVSGG